MNVDDFRAELEAELAWRQEDLAFFRNRLNDINEEDKGRYRKSLVLILYSHMEGFVKICLQIYIHYINSLNLERKDVCTGLMVASMHKEFLAYENLDRKCDIFRKELPEDARLHRLFRRVDFIDQIEAFESEILHIEDSVIDTESNLWYIVLQKNLYKIGLPVNLFEEYRSSIDALVNRRNSIAHGDSKAGVTEQEYKKWEESVESFLSGIIRLLYEYSKHNRFMST